jgi:uncharacterized protein YbaA (DUF1428 family)
MTYVDAFVAAVPTANKDAYYQHAMEAAALFKEYGALKITECWGDDIPEGKITSLPIAVKKTDAETVVFSWIVWPSKETRDAGWAKVMADERMNAMELPFDGKRLIYGGFDVMLEI